MINVLTIYAVFAKLRALEREGAGKKKPRHGWATRATMGSRRFGIAISKRLRGTPQGGPLSPLLANIYLGPLDRELEQRGIAFVRYVDDVALFLSSERAAALPWAPSAS